MRRDLRQLATQNDNRRNMLVTKLCDSLLGNAVPLITVSEDVRVLKKLRETQAQQQQQQQSWGEFGAKKKRHEERRQYVVVSARVRCV